IAFLVCLELISQKRRPLHEIVSEVDPYVRSGEINSRVDSIPDKITLVSQAFAAGRQDTEDGLTVAYDDWWFNVRPSNTEPLLRLNVEAKSKAVLGEKTKQILAIIRS
ncbi:MAG TPA: phosphomannomutase CpsG, partial [Candidatus Deferrimicrobium sp.]|nr:phosphomannomutase CpsG [Candidatus Deferrimicrobium sp.]